MISKIKDHFLRIDWIMFFSIFLLSLFGLMEIYSIALGQEVISLSNFNRQVLYIILSVILFFLISFVDYKLLRSFSNYIYILGILFLVIVLFFGETFRGTTGWLSVFGFNIQVVEFVKIVLIIFLAKIFSNSFFKNKPIKTLLFSFFGSFLIVFLVLLQPDFGPAAIMLILWFVILVLAGIEKKYLLLIIIPSLLVSILTWNFYFEDYQKDRILTFLNPGADILGDGYNVSQALIAVGSGGLMGRGVGFGSQSQLRFLPEAQNDFIFSVISEELGFLGALLVLIIYFVLFYRLLTLVKKTRDDFATFFVLGSMVLIFIKMFINIGMNIGIVPIVGISLPFISYGGSAMIASFILMAIVQNIAANSKS